MKFPVVTKPAKPNAVKPKALKGNAQIEELIALRKSHAVLNLRLIKIAEVMNQIEDEIIVQVEAGAKFSKYGVAVLTSSRRSPRWKEHFIEVAGKARAAEVLDETPPTFSKKLVISSQE